MKIESVFFLFQVDFKTPETPPPKKKRVSYRALQGAPPKGRQLYLSFPSALDPLFKASKAPFLTLRVAAPSGALRQAPLEVKRTVEM